MAKKKRSDREDEKRRVAFAAGQRKIQARRRFVTFLFVIPMLGWIGCGSGTPLDVMCVLPRDTWILVWFALLGSFLGLTIRLYLERRRFEKAQRAAASPRGPDPARG